MPATVSISPQKRMREHFIFTTAPQPTVGDSFFLINQIDSLGIQNSTSIRTVQAFAGVMADLGGSAWGKVSRVECQYQGQVKGLLELASIRQPADFECRSFFRLANSDPFTWFRPLAAWPPPASLLDASPRPSCPTWRRAERR